jgi:uncharacterized protein
MVHVKKLVLDVLKPHQPNALEFGQAIAAAGGEYRVRVMVLEVDEHTESLQVVIEGDAIDFETVQSCISNLGASLHSIDEVEVQGNGEAD